MYLNTYGQSGKHPFVSMAFHDDRSDTLAQARRTAFQNLIRYMVRLRNEGHMDDQAFDALVRQAAASYSGAEISERIEKVLVSKISSGRLRELLQ
ncbi:hypothetical protein OOT00_15395 [Desulfobotulus sp. H1]|uniref:Antitoxin VbhA domain-containing protein n=1 Tax=Desulfobotulus pelophilus TaxID=2823377 RepID=A0ABT3ND25_9BACT|nr:hypothetical protein [Desulfobotulus pelophilus]MCW7755368.1 hypothetical protein [Desulfobotulus pelophilus]